MPLTVGSRRSGNYVGEVPISELQTFTESGDPSHQPAHEKARVWSGITDATVIAREARLLNFQRCCAERAASRAKVLETSFSSDRVVNRDGPCKPTKHNFRVAEGTINSMVGFDEILCGGSFADLAFQAQELQVAVVRSLCDLVTEVEVHSVEPLEEEVDPQAMLSSGKQIRKDSSDGHDDKMSTVYKETAAEQHSKIESTTPQEVETAEQAFEHAIEEDEAGGPSAAQRSGGNGKAVAKQSNVSSQSSVVKRNVRYTCGLLTLFLRAYAKHGRPPPPLCVCVPLPKSTAPMLTSNGNVVHSMEWEVWIKQVASQLCHACNCEYSKDIIALQRTIITLTRAANSTW